jgi:hypothetical protein
MIKYQLPSSARARSCLQDQSRTLSAEAVPWLSPVSTRMEDDEYFGRVADERAICAGDGLSGMEDCVVVMSICTRCRMYE